MTTMMTKWSVALSAAIMMNMPAFAADGTWINTAGGSWPDTANWSGAAVADGIGGVADFSTVDLPADATVTLDANRTIGCLFFDDTTPSHTWTINQGTPAGILTLAVSGAAPTVDVRATVVTIGAIVAGTAGLVKDGTGTLVLAGANSYSGATVVNQGILVHSNTYSSAAQTVAAGAVIEFNATSGTRDYGLGTTFTGAGTLRKTGAGQVLWGPGGTTFSLAAGSLIDIQQGTFVGGSSANENWIANLSGMHVEAGAVFRGVEANVRLDALTGAGSIRTGYPKGAGADSYTNLTCGVNNGSGIFYGLLTNDAGAGFFVKTGTGTQTLAGTSAHTGSTSVNGGMLVINGTNSGPDTVFVNTGGTLGGVGLVAGMVINNGTLAPGDAGIGTFTANSSVTLAGTTEMEIDRSVSPSSDKLDVNATLTCGGTLVVTNIGTALVANDSFVLFSAGTFEGGFATIQLPALAAGLEWDTSTIAIDGTIAVKAIASTNPYIDITNANYSVDNGIAAVGLGGSNNAHAVGGLRWTNILTGANGGMPVGTPWWSCTVPVAFGPNLITVMGTNTAGIMRSDSVTVMRNPPSGAWINPAGGSWIADTNWQDNVIADGIDNIADFSWLNLTADATVTLDADRTIGHLMFNDTVPGNDWTINAGSPTGVLTLSCSSSASTIDVENCMATIGAVIAGVNGIIKSGGGSLALNAANTYGGGTVVSRGTLRIKGLNNAGSGGITLGDDATGTNDVAFIADYGSDDTGPNVTVSSNGSGTAMISLTTQNQSLNSIITLNRPTTITASPASGGTYVNFDGSGKISGTVGTLTLQSTSGRLYIDSYVGGHGNNFIGTVCLPLGSVWAWCTDSFGLSNDVIMSGTAALNMPAMDLAIGSLSGAPGNTINLNTFTLMISSPSNTVFNGVINGGGGVTKSGTGAQTFAGVNTYGGPTTVNGGTLVVNGLLPSLVTVALDATLAGTGTVGNVTMLTGSRYYFELHGGGSSDFLKVNTTLDLTQPGVTVHIQAVEPILEDETNTVIAFGATNGDWANVTVTYGEGTTGTAATIIVEPNAVKVTGVNGVPEPAAAGALFVIGYWLFAWRSRMRGSPQFIQLGH